MEKSLLVGDFLFVNKFNYGSRIPNTILQIPLTHQVIWGTNIKFIFRLDSITIL